MQFIVVLDSPEGSFCFTDVAAHDCSQMNYCGVSYEEATSCSYPCPSGSSFECPSGLTCFLNISAGTCRNNGFCGKSRELAKQNCAVTCEADDDCGVSEYCYRGIAAQDCGSYNYCGTSLADAQTCSLPCPLGRDDECPLFEVCFLNVDNEECTSTDINHGTGGVVYNDDGGGMHHDYADNRFCGKTKEDSMSCASPCMNDEDSDCPSGEYW